MQYENMLGDYFLLPAYLVLYNGMIFVIIKENNKCNFNKVTMDPYLRQKVLSASPQQLIVYLYDLGIASCNNKNKIKLIKVLITHLKESLI